MKLRRSPTLGSATTRKAFSTSGVRNSKTRFPLMIHAGGDAAAIGFDLLLGRARRRLGRREEMHDDSPTPSDGDRDAATDHGQHPLVLLVLQKQPNLFPHDGTTHRKDQRSFRNRSTPVIENYESEFRNGRKLRRYPETHIEGAGAWETYRPRNGRRSGCR
jgi:hypothetical protein